MKVATIKNGNWAGAGHQGNEMRKAAILFFCIAALPISALAQSRQGKIDVPVMAGSEPDMDACPSTGSIVGLDPRGDGFLSVRSGPGGARYREIDRLYNGMHVYICDQQGPWLGVVYSRNNSILCNVSSSWTRRQPYTGPCNYGWIHSKFVGDLAG